MRSSKGSMFIRVPKADAAFLYALLEAYEGVLIYTTFIGDKHLPYRDIHVFSTDSMQEEFFRVLEIIRKETGFEEISEGTRFR